MRRFTVKLPRCPECGSFNLRKHAGGRYRCNVCGKTFYRHEEPPKVPIREQAFLVADYIISGMSQYSFAMERGKNRSTLNKYLKKFRNRKMLWIWRIPRFWKNEEKEGFEFVRRELLERNILRQGWGEVSIYDRESMVIIHGERRFDILKPMVLIKEGDIILVPRIENEDYQSFIIVRALEGYRFDPDAVPFGHTVRVEPLFYFTNSGGMALEANNGIMRAIVDIVEELRIRWRLKFAVFPAGCLDISRFVEYRRLRRGVNRILSIL